MQFFRGRILYDAAHLGSHPEIGFVLHIEKRRSIGWSGQQDWVRVWTLGALVGAFLSGLLIGVALGYTARALRVPGFVKYQASKIAVDDQRFATCRLPSRPSVGRGNTDGACHREGRAGGDRKNASPPEIAGHSARSTRRSRRIARAIVRSRLTAFCFPFAGQPWLGQ